MRLKDLREDNDLPQRQPAEFLHVKQNTYSQYKTSAHQFLIDVLIRSAEFYNVSTDYPLELTAVKTPY